jgi:predicted PurR-regulated permease PerM
MTERKADFLKLSQSIIALILTVMILKLGAAIFVKISIAVFFAILISPAVTHTANKVDRLLRRLSKKYRRRGERSQSNLASIIGTAVVLVVALFLIAVFFFLIYGTLSMLVSRKDSMISNVINPVVNFEETVRMRWIPELYSHIGLKDVNRVTSETDTLQIAANPIPAVRPDQNMLSVGSIVPTAAGVLGTVSTGLLDTVIIIMLTVFMVNARKSLSEKIKEMDSAVHLRYQTIARGIETVPRKYLLAKLLMSSLTGLLIGLGLFAMGFQVDEAFIWAITAMMFDFIPIFGPIASGAMIVLYVISVRGMESALLAVTGILVINNVVSNIIEPGYFGNVLPIGKITVLLCLIIWGSLWGLVGVFLAVPLTIMIKVLLEQMFGRNSIVVFMEV